MNSLNTHLVSHLAGLTDEVPAASSGGAADPVSLEHADLPVALRVVGQGVGGHVADLHLVVVLLEVLKLHPEVTNTISDMRSEHIASESKQGGKKLYCAKISLK